MLPNDWNFGVGNMARFQFHVMCGLYPGAADDAGGCVGALVVGGLAAAGGGGYAAAQERGVGGTADDFAVKTDVQTALVDADPTLRATLNAPSIRGGCC